MCGQKHEYMIKWQGDIVNVIWLITSEGGNLKDFNINFWVTEYSLSLLFETITILWNGINKHQIEYNGAKKWLQSIKQV